MNVGRLFRYSHAGMVHLQRSVFARLSRRRLTPLGPPLTVAIGITTRCNSRCLHCDVWRSPPGEELRTDDWKRLLDELAEWMSPAHVSFAGGEPFLRKDIVELITHAHAVDLLPSIVTNGTVTSPDRVDMIQSLPLTSMTVSIDSLSPGPHDRLHGINNAHRRAVDLVEGLVSVGLGARLRIAAVLTSLNNDEIVPLAKWSHSLGIGGFTIQPLGEPFERDHNAKWYDRSPLRFTDRGTIHDLVTKLISLKESGVPIMNPVRQLEALPEYYIDPERGAFLPCLVGSTTLGIGPNGDLRFCPYHSPFGRWVPGSLKSQWFGDNARRSRRTILQCNRGCSIMNCAFSPTLTERLIRWRGLVR